MTTYTTMKKQILVQKLRAFLYRKRDVVRRGFSKTLFIEKLQKGTIGKCIRTINTTTGQTHGFHIILSVFFVNNYPDKTDSFKKLILHEIAHTHRHARGHDMKFRKTARRIGAGNFSSSYCYVVRK